MPQPAATSRLLAATGPVALAGPVDLPIPLPPTHPLGHGSLRLALTVQDQVVVAADPLVGLLHRGAEKLFEVRDYRQVLMLANRHDWLGSFTGELSVALVVEQALRLEVPERAVWVRTLLAELTRVTSHLAFLEALPLGGEPVAGARPPIRESLVELVADVSGSRMHTMLVQVGGLRADLPDGWPQRARQVLGAALADLPALLAPVREPAFRARARGVAVLTTDDALTFGASGPVGRASGLDFDLRRDARELAYPELAAAVTVRTEGDVLARIEVLAEETEQTLRLAVACLDRLDTLDGPVEVRLPKVLRVPQGDWYAALESPLGAAGCYLVSRGDKVPWRLKLRTPSFQHAAALAALLPGTRVADLPLALASVPLVMGDVEK